MASQQIRESAALSRLRATSAAILVSILLQFALAIGILSGVHSMTGPHGWLGYFTFLACGVGSFFAWQASKADPARKGAFFHVLGMFVISIIQIGLAEAAHGAGTLKWVHVVLGILFTVAAIGLFAMLRKRP